MQLFQPNVKDQGVVLNSGLTMYDHISSVCCSAHLELCRVGSICPFLTIEATAELAHSCNLSRLTTAILFWLAFTLNR